MSIVSQHVQVVRELIAVRSDVEAITAKRAQIGSTPASRSTGDRIRRAEGARMQSVGSRFAHTNPDRPAIAKGLVSAGEAIASYGAKVARQARAFDTDVIGASFGAYYDRTSGKVVGSQAPLVKTALDAAIATLPTTLAATQLLRNLAELHVTLATDSAVLGDVAATSKLASYFDSIGAKLSEAASELATVYPDQTDVTAGLTQAAPALAHMPTSVRTINRCTRTQTLGILLGCVAGSRRTTNARRSDRRH